MKKNPNPFKPAHGFTLVELLVTITIIAALAALAFTMGPKMKKKGEGAKSVMNMRQIGSAMGLYMAENSGGLPAAKQVIKNSDGSTSDVHWHQVLLAQVYTDVETWKFGDRKWWDTNKPFLRNPLMTDKTKPLAFAPWFPGYSYNMQINYVVTGSYDWAAEVGAPQSQGIPISKIPEPARTPLVATRGDWHFSGKDLANENVKPFLVDGKLPIMFVDGHVESMTQKEYYSRKLDEMPKK